MFPQKIPSLIMMTILFVFALSFKAQASPPPSALNFKSWKEQQILNAQNRLFRASSELENNKNTETAKGEGHEKGSKAQKALNRFHRSNEKSTRERLENDLQLAKEALSTANELTVDDYLTIYIPTLSQTPEALSALIESMSPEEVSHLLLEILKKQSDQRDKSPSSAAKLSGFRVGSTLAGK